MINFLVVVALVVHGATSAFFDLTDIDDPLALFWNTKNTAFQKNAACTPRNKDDPDGPTEGTCKHITHCILSGGKPNGNCGILDTCCTYDKSCGKETKQKVSYFTGMYNTDLTSPCRYTIRLMPNVCQVRLDFEKFSFEPADIDTTRMTTRCVYDSLTITPDNYRLPEFCGNNDGQHVYVHVDPKIDSTVVLAAHITNRATSDKADLLQNPSWRIKATQLQCPGYSKDLFNKEDTSIRDFPLLAPKGALQYFTESSGNIRSFGLPLNVKTTMAATSPYISNLYYTIAFKSDPGLCGIRFTPNFVRLQLAAPAGCVDYLLLPEYAKTTSPDRYCPLMAATTPITTNNPGMLFIYFRSSAAQVPKDRGFNMDYMLSSC